jgi:hypothetical protein
MPKTDTPKNTTVNGVRYALKQCEVIRIEDEFGHSYMIDEEPVAGVTTLLSMGMPVEQGLLEYFKRTGKEEQEDILIDAQERGSNVHHAIEALLLGDSVPSANLYRKREKLGVAAFVDFFMKTKPTDLVSEQVVAYIDEQVRCAGTLDFIGTFGGKRILIDWKTSVTHARKNEVQVETYKAAVEQSSDEKIDACYILYLGTTHKGTRFTIDDNGLPNTGVGWSLVRSRASFNDFKRAYDTALFMNNGAYPKPPKVLNFPEEWKILERKRKETK